MLAFAKFLDQKQGEARVVDQQQALRQRLAGWLASRPSAGDLAERGLLGRAQRFAAASAVVDRLLRARLQAREDELVRIPAGSFRYTPGVSGLLGGADADGDGAACLEGLQERLGLLAREREAAARRLDEAAGAWAEAAEDCQRQRWACAGALPCVAAGAGRAVQQLEAHRASSGESLAGVFEELAAFQRMLARKRALASVVEMVEETDAVREAVFASGGSALPISRLEDLAHRCGGLPSRSRAVGLRRLGFVVGPSRTILEHALRHALEATRRWTLDTTAPPALETDECAEARARAVRCCAELERLQRVAALVSRGAPVEAQRRAGGRGAPEEEEDLGPWACRALAEPIIARFRYHFCRPESALCRMDQPDRAFKYVTHVMDLHTQELDRWLPDGAGGAPASGGTASADGGGAKVDLAAGLALALAQEARLFVRSRMPLLAAPSPEARPLLLNTMTHFVKFHGDVTRDFGGEAGAAAFADFSQNRPLQAAAPDAAAPDVTSVVAEAEDPAGDGALAEGTAQADGGLLGARLAGGLRAGFSHLAKNAPAAPGVPGGPPAPGGAPPAPPAGRGGGGAGAASGGFLDAWAAADAGSVREKLSAAMAEGGSAWQRQALRLRRLSGPVDGEEPEAARLAALLADLCEASRSRAECLSTPAARSIYTARVLEPGVRDAMGAVRARWNAVGDLLAEARDASLLIETMEEMCRFFDRFPLGEHMVSVVDEVNTMRLGMIEKTSDALADAVRKVLRRLDTESAVFSYALGPALAILSCRLRPSNFQLVATQGVGKIAETLMGELLRQAPFADDDRMGLFSSNCGGDLPAVLSVVSDPSCLRPLATLLEGCTLLGLDKARAAELISVLRQVKRCSSSRPAVLDLAEAAPSSDVLRQRQAEAYDAAGVADISVGDALSVLLKRPDLMGTMTVDDLEDAPFSTLQDLLPAGAMLGGLGGGALQPLQLGAGTAHATLQRGAGAAQATFQLGARGLAGGAGLLKGTLQRGLAGAAAAAR